jgi:hypothetical protein
MRDVVGPEYARHSFMQRLTRLVVDGFTPSAARGVDGRVVAADRDGKVSGVATLSVEITRLRTADGGTAIQTESLLTYRRFEAAGCCEIGAGAAIVR